MFEGFDSKPSFKRDIAHVFDAVSSYLAKKTKKVKQNTIRIYIGYDTSTGSMGHFSIVQAAPKSGDTTNWGKPEIIHNVDTTRYVATFG